MTTKLKIKSIDCYFCGFAFEPHADRYGDLTCPECKLTETKDSVVRRLRKKYPNLYHLFERKFINDPYKDGLTHHESGYIEGPQNPYYKEYG